MTIRFTRATAVALALTSAALPYQAASHGQGNALSSEIDEGCCLSGGVDPDSVTYKADPDALEPASQAMLFCQAENARDNRPNSPLRRGYDYVPISVDDSIGFYVVYSERIPASNQNITGPVGNTAGIYIFDLGPNEVLIFGSGYGNHYVATNSARHDVLRVEEVVGGCLGYNPSNTVVHFTTPHGHGDHINSEFMKELQTAGFSIAQIAYHIADSNIVNGVGGWTTQLRNLFNPLIGGNPPHGYPCGQELLSFNSPAGKIWFVWRGTHHTNGGMDLIVDVRNNPKDRVLIQGSLTGGLCAAPPSGVRWRFKSHGNLRVEHEPTVVGYGCGVNPNASLTIEGGAPKLDRWIEIGIDNPFGTQNIGSRPMLVLSTQPDPRYPCGGVNQAMGMSGPGEILVSNDPNHRLRPSFHGPAWAGPGIPSVIRMDIPNDPTLLGMPIYAQGVMVDPNATTGPRIGLTAAVELRFGP